MKKEIHFLSPGLLALLLLISILRPAQAQQRMGDNFGNHQAIKNLDMNGQNINHIQVVNAENMVIGTANTITNSSILLQVNGNNKAILIPRVTDLLNATSPSIPLANVLEGMIVYDLATHAFYVRDNSTWQTYAQAGLANGQIYMGDSSGNRQQVNVAGDVTFSNTGVSAIGTSKVLTAMVADQSVTLAKIAIGSAGQFIVTNAAGTSTGTSAGMPGSNYLDLSNKQNNIKGLKTFISDSGFVAEGTASSVAPSAATAGVKMMWYPRKPAFRAGSFSAANLSDAAMGTNSAAFGNGSIASGTGSFATGASSATGFFSAALGNSTSGDYGFAAGKSVAINGYATASGKATASQMYALAMGMATASNTAAVAMGDSSVTASGEYSLALGSSVTASGDLSFAWSAPEATILNNSTNNRFASRFSGGYILYSNAGASTGTQLPAGGSSWSTLSDKRKKENFALIDHAVFLSRMDTLFAGSWNYKEQDPKLFRHYGPMAQDFYGAFGTDRFGKIGNDTTIVSADIDGVAMTLIQGLVKRTHDLKQRIKGLKNNNLAMYTTIKDQQIANRNTINALKIQIAQQRMEAEKSLSVYDELNKDFIKKMKALQQQTEKGEDPKKETVTVLTATESK